MLRIWEEMLALFRLARRNVLRQRTRTAMTLAAIAFGVIGLILSGGFVQDIFIQLGEAVIHSQSGHLQVAKAGFAAAAEPDTLLTPRELEVLGAIGEGLTNKAIARKLGISLHTVKFHVESLFRKLGARTRTEAVTKALDQQHRETIEL